MKSFSLQEGFRGHEICRVLYCHWPGLGCGATAAYRAFDGTTCDNRKWCHEGRCVDDSRAPVIPDQTSKWQILTIFPVNIQF